MSRLALPARSSALLRPHTPSPSLFLLPFLHRPIPPSRRPFSVSNPKASRIGSGAIAIPENVHINIMEPVVPKEITGTREGPPPRRVQVEGPLGKLSIPIPSYVQVTQDPEAKKLKIAVEDKSQREQRQMWGTIRALLNNHVLGVSEGHTAILTLTGVGYRASLESSAAHKTPAYPGQQFLSLKLGYSHPVDMPVPVSIKTSIPQPTRILLEGTDKQEVNQFAAEIREWKRPEPYKGKGIFLNDETIKLKAKKIK